MTDIRIKRAYRAARVSDGQRILVDRLWPRGMARHRLRIAAWEKDIAPSDDLRRWFNHDPGKWEEFRNAYIAELDQNPEAVDRLCDMARKDPVTLVYGAKDEAHNNAVVLKEYLERRLET
ncbi:DUF488 domain-containing protein [Roseovarius amoyensis]|uniref:DUF488 domain-containing protein n=1 Tax=Roseovarius amoyensis TaxID=2211448 RepID=UPI000DBE8E45|nr:DUF488 family protein [Roseovarius amoyensis]